jgi:hypothetical protein
LIYILEHPTLFRPAKRGVPGDSAKPVLARIQRGLPPVSTEKIPEQEEEHADDLDDLLGN